jgi:hypothetical protein
MVTGPLNVTSVPVRALAVPRYLPLYLYCPSCGDFRHSRKLAGELKERVYLDTAPCNATQARTFGYAPFLMRSMRWRRWLGLQAGRSRV